ncbi:hypothetical protein [Hoyosella subflava]|uniref:Uncharacterized protein n=1 Tax=Hoyosella subflava (strain DSM 45089 / JCM 17490 / NBRC 109087 / DQS3-9A1) TaxID=443218 RepID=F6ELV8_HOYSD|nr:hypothetical protein [Hoyosella subflava]AEF42739.1 hypothetical protein AS9A_4306 [Hoyosella subflava DQS3-9A1]
MYGLQVNQLERDIENGFELSHREYRLLRLVAAGRATMSCSCEPDLYIDGRCFCDQFAVHRLTSAALIQPARSGDLHDVVPAQLTPSGWACLHNDVQTYLPPAA